MIVLKAIAYLLTVIAVVTLSCVAIYYIYLGNQGMPHCTGAGCQPFSHTTADAAYFTGRAAQLLGTIAGIAYLLSLPSLAVSKARAIKLSTDDKISSLFAWAIGFYALGGFAFLLLLGTAFNGSGVTAP